jgi:NAD(P)-dependent dehydrogenase (short-subunit alcohol dehydrogenase family)
MNLDEINELYNFAGRTAVIPGGAGVLGGEMACTLVGCGANVVILDRDPGLADRFKDRLGCGPGCAIALYADVLKRDTLLQARESILTEFGRADILINAAGGNSDQATTSPELSFFDLSEGALQAVINLNLMGTILPSQVFGKVMADQGEGVILNISSMNSFRPLTRVPGYSSAKAAVSNFTQWLAVHMAQEYSPHIRVNAIAPGFFHTKQNHYLLYQADSGELTDRGRSILEHTPMKRFGRPEDLLGSVLWLISPASNFVSGVVVPIDGGFSAFSGV